MSSLPATQAPAPPAANVDPAAVVRMLTVLAPLAASFPLADFCRADDDDKAGIAAVYVEALTGHSPTAIQRAIFQHLRDPEQGRFWPSPAHILRFLPRVAVPETPRPMDPNADAFDQWRGRCLRGDRSRDALAPHQQAALQVLARNPAQLDDIGWTILRRDFLERCEAYPDATPRQAPRMPTEEELLAERRAEEQEHQRIRDLTRDARWAAAASLPRGGQEKPAGVSVDASKPGHGRVRPATPPEEQERAAARWNAWAQRLQAEREARGPWKACTAGCLLDDPGDDRVTCEESGTCEREFRAQFKVGA